MDRPYHEPVMSQEVVDLFRPLSGILVDATFGGGGHTRRLLDELGSGITVVAIDRDPQARRRGEELGVRVLAGNFADLDTILDGAGVEEISGVLFDFGVSSRQLDDPDRGFSYHHDGPLDMRMDPDSPITAADLVNNSTTNELTRILGEYGEERFARRVAEAIVEARPLHRTSELAEVIKSAMPAAARRGRHPARKTFQALRIATNDELAAIRAGLDAGIRRLRVGGRCVAISYHSLEDRIVKRRMAEGARGCTCPPELPVCGCGADPELRVLTSNTPSDAEIASNPRARSARLRACEKRRAS